MPSQFSEVGFHQIPELDGYSVVTPEGTELRHLVQVGTVNVFVGPNNVGKSRFLRGLFAAKQMLFRVASTDLGAISSAVRSFINNAQALYGPRVIGIGAFGELSRFAAFTSLDWFSDGDEGFATLQKELGKVASATNPGQVRFNGSMSAPSQQEIDRIFRLVLAQAQNLASTVDAAAPAAGNEERIYIPILRGLRRPQSERSTADVYAVRTQADYFAHEGNIFSGLGIYDELKNLLLGTHAERSRVAEYERFLSTELFEGREVELTPHRSGDVVHIRIEKDERAIHQLGDGIQSLIIMTFPAFTAPARSLFFVEEPETHLHPGMQRKLLELMLRHERLNRHQYFATSHSNHLLDMAGEYAGCTTFLVRKAAEGNRPFQIRALGKRDRDAMRDLGVRSSSVFLTNATVWVEGIK